MMDDVSIREIRKRRTFAIISHPDERLSYCAEIPVALLDPVCERVSRGQGEKFEPSVGRSARTGSQIRLSR